MGLVEIHKIIRQQCHKEADGMFRLENFIDSDVFCVHGPKGYVSEPLPYGPARDHRREMVELISAIMFNERTK